MKIIDCVQGSPEWLALRMGRPTASQFNRIITPGGKESKAGDDYLAELVASWWLGQETTRYESGFMTRGSEEEENAVNQLAFELDVEPVKVGFCMTDDESVGCSPDRLIDDDGLWEVKCPSAAVHMKLALEGAHNDYFVQAQGQLYVTGRKWCDVVMFHPVFPRVVKRYEPDPEFMSDLHNRLEDFCTMLARAKERFADQREAYQKSRKDAEWEAQVSL